MNDAMEEFFNTMLTFFPSLASEYKRHIEKYNKRLDTVVIEDVFMPEITKLLKQNCNNNLISSIFEYFERVANSSDKYLHDVFMVTVMEVLGNDKKILEIAKHYMGPKATQLQKKADRALGRN